MRIALLLITGAFAGRAWPQIDTAAPAGTATGAQRPAVIVEEEDIFGELSKQGLSITGTEASILNGRRDTAVNALLRDSAVGSAKAGPAVAPAPVAGSDSATAQPVPHPGADARRSGRYGKYGQGTEPPGPPPGDIQRAEPKVDSVPAGPAVVEAPRSVNFARNLKEYRSPKLAMLLSLVLPGLGQAYARNYWKTAIFGVLEATVIGFSIAYNVKGRHELEDARGFADKHYDPGKSRFEAYYNALYGYFSSLQPCHSDTTYDAQREMDYIYWRPDTTELFLSYYRRERDAQTNTYYDWIGSAPFVQGWDDCEPRFEDDMLGASAGQILLGGRYEVHPHVDEGCNRPDSAFLVYILPDTVNVYFGYSANQHTYNKMVSTANSSRRVSTNVLFLLLVNHIASAIDAGITAKRYNDRMLGRQTLWDRMHLVPQAVNSGSEMATGYALLVDF